jgi:hypothetical protein
MERAVLGVVAEVVDFADYAAALPARGISLGLNHHHFCNPRLQAEFHRDKPVFSPAFWQSRLP